MKDINKSSNNKIIIPMPWRHVTTMYLFFSEEQLNVVIGSALLSVCLLGISTLLSIPWKLIPIMAMAGVWIAFYRYARSHEILRRSKALYKYHMRRMRGYTITQKYNKSLRSTMLARSLYPLRRILKNGLIDFGSNKWGYLIVCTPRKTIDEESIAQIQNIQHFLNSFSHKILLKISARSQIPVSNAVQNMTMKKISNSKTQQEKALLYSLYNMSADAPKAPKWYFTMLIGIESPEKEIEAFSKALMPGITKMLEHARIPCRVLTAERDILTMYVNDFSSFSFSDHGRKPAMFSEKSIWNDLVRRLMPGQVDERDDCIIVNKQEFVSCVLVGIPRGGVSGYPSDLSPALLSQLFEISVGDESLLKLDLSILPIETPEAVQQVKRTMDRIDANAATAKGRKVIQQDLQVDRDDYEILLNQLKNGEEKLHNCSFLISVYSPSYDAMIAGISKVKAILSANNVLGDIPYGKVLESLKSARLFPYLDFDTAVELPTRAVSRITPLISNSNSKTDAEGTYFGNDGDEEIIINLDELAAQHTLLIGPTGSGKTTALLQMIDRELSYLNRKSIYITVKQDKGTDYRALAQYFQKQAQIVDLGSKDSGETFYNINPLEILVDTSVEFHAETVFFRHISILKKFFTVLGKLDSVNQIAYLELSLMELYANFGMHPMNPETWNPAQPPTLRDLHDLWARDRDINVSADALYNKFTSINFAWKFLSTPTNVDLSKKFIVIDLSGIPADLSEAMNYYLTAILALRFNISAKQRTSIYIDEGRVFLKNPMLADDIVTYLSQARSFGVKITLATQHVSDLRNCSEEFKSNTFVSLILTNNAIKSIDVIQAFFNLAESDVQYIRNSNRQGQALLQVGPPYNQSYHIFMKLSPLEEEIILGKKQATALVSLFPNPALEAFAEEQGVTFADWMDGDTSSYRATREAVFQQRAIGTGRSYAFIEKKLFENELIKGQSPDHFLTVTYIAGYLISKGIPTTVNHFDDADIVAELPDGPVAFEYQTAGNNRPERIMAKRQSGENKYGRLFFIANSESLPELRKILHSDEIIVSRGKALEDLINRLIEEADKKAELKPPVLAV